MHSIPRLFRNGKKYFINENAAGRASGINYRILAFCTHLSEALAAVNGTVSLGLEGNLGFAAATGTGSSEELAGSAGVVLTGIAAGLATLGLILEATLCVELLLAGSEGEFVAALFAH